MLLQCTPASEQITCYKQSKKKNVLFDSTCQFFVRMYHTKTHTMNSPLIEFQVI